MQTLTSPRQATPRSASQAVFEFLMSKVTSRHGKRIIFVTSLYFKVVRIERLKTDAIAKLNTIMQLATSEDALRLPAALRGMVWRFSELPEALNEEILDTEVSMEEALELSEKVVAASPVWVRYGRDDMVKDVLDLIRQGGQLAPPLAA